MKVNQEMKKRIEEYYDFMLAVADNYNQGADYTGTIRLAFDNPPPPPPELNANNNDTFTLEIIFDEKVTILANNISIQDIPSNPYTYNVVLETTDIEMSTTSTTMSSFNLRQNYPNPFNPNTTIEFSLPSNEQVKIEIYDVL